MDARPASRRGCGGHALLAVGPEAGDFAQDVGARSIPLREPRVDINGFGQRLVALAGRLCLKVQESIRLRRLRK